MPTGDNGRESRPPARGHVFPRSEFEWLLNCPVTGKAIAVPNASPLPPSFSMPDLEILRTDPGNNRAPACHNDQPGEGCEELDQ
jgi:hypothetical protein